MLTDQLIDFHHWSTYSKITLYNIEMKLKNAAISTALPLKAARPASLFRLQRRGWLYVSQMHQFQSIYINQSIHQYGA